MKTIDPGQMKERRYWRRWYLALILWLAVLILLFTLFTEMYQ